MPPAQLCLCLTLSRPLLLHLHRHLDSGCCAEPVPYRQSSVPDPHLPDDTGLPMPKAGGRLHALLDAPPGGCGVLLACLAHLSALAGLALCISWLETPCTGSKTRPRGCPPERTWNRARPAGKAAAGALRRRRGGAPRFVWHTWVLQKRCSSCTAGAVGTWVGLSVGCRPRLCAGWHAGPGLRCCWGS